MDSKFGGLVGGLVLEFGFTKAAKCIQVLYDADQVDEPMARELISTLNELRFEFDGIANRYSLS